MELLEFARGPGLAVSVAVVLAGLAWRLYGIFRRPARPDLSEPRRRDAASGGLRAVFAKMLPPRNMKIRGAQMANAYGYHIALAAGVAIVGLLIALVARLGDGMLRLLSNFDDYFSWAVTMLPLLTGMALLPMPAQPVPLAIHLLSFELLLVWLPFGKLAHAALVFVSRWRTGSDFTRKGAAV